MKTGIPWQVKGVRPEARDTAREAARRSGVSVGEWLNNVIIEQAGQDVEPDHYDDDAWRSGSERRSHDRPYARPDDRSDDRSDDRLGAVSERLERLTQQLHELADATVTNRSRGAADSDYVAAAIAKLDQRLGQMLSEGRPEHYASEQPPAPRTLSDLYRAPASYQSAPAFVDPIDSLDRAVAEITARQFALEQSPTAALRPSAYAPPPIQTYAAVAPPPAPAYPPPPQVQAYAPPLGPPSYAAPPAARPAEAYFPPAPAPLQPDPPPPPASAYMPPSRPAQPPAAPPVARPAPRADVLPRPSTQDLSGLEQQLRDITNQIEALRQPTAGLAQAVAGLRGELSEISHGLQDALPRRAIEALEKEVRGLADRIVKTRDTGADPELLAGLERGLIEVRDTVRTLTPAENLGALHLTVEGLARKIDSIAGGGQDPAMLHQLEEAIATLRGVMSHVASNDALAALTEEMRSLAVKVDEVGRTAVSSAASSDMLSHIDRRFETLAEAMEARIATGGATSPRFEAVVQSLTEKLERLGGVPGDHTAVGALEDRIANLVQKLDASDARLNHLEAIEHALAELLIHLEQQRARNGGPARNNTARAIAPLSEPEEVQRELDAIRIAEARNQDSLEAAHGTLEHVVDRLAMIETDIRQGAASPAPPIVPLPEPVAARAPVARAINPIPASPPAPPKMAPPPKIEHRPIDPTLPPDHPLEPGLGAAPGRPASPAARIAASEAALGPSKPPVIPDPGNKGDFIAAARRAALAASATAAADAAPTRATIEPERKLSPEPSGTSIAKRMRSLFIGASVVAIVVGTLQLTARLIGPVDEALKSASQTRATAAPVAAEPVTPDVDNDPGPSAPPAPPAAAPPDRPAPAPATPGRGAALPTSGDVTGSIPQPATSDRTGSIPPAPPSMNDLPVAIGSVALRSAAAGGNAPAAYEVGNRYAEGRGVPQNPAEAARWYERAANAGLVPAQFRLAGLYEKGIGVSKNLDTARRLYLAAAKAGNGKAMHNLAVIYAEGVDGRPDYQNALPWFLKGAEHDVNDSQYNLGVLYARGIGVAQNFAESYKWFAIAARDGDKSAAQKRDEVASRLDPQALTAARLAVQTWMPQPQPDAAVNVQAPPGGWDVAFTTPTGPGKRTVGTSAATRPRPPSQHATQ